MLSTIRSSNSIPCPANSSATRRDGQEKPIRELHDVRLVDRGHFLAAVVQGVAERVADDLLRSGNTYRFDRNTGLVSAGPDTAVATELVDEIHQRRSVRLPLLEFHARVQIFRVLPHDDEVDRYATEVAPHPAIILAGPHTRIQPQLLAKMHVDAAKARAHGRGDRGLQGTPGTADAFQDGIGQRIARPLHEVHARLLYVPVDLHARGIHAPPGRFGEFRSRAITGDQGDFMHHFSALLAGGSTIFPKLYRPRLEMRRS